jgi:hypothetical protein
MPALPAISIRHPAKHARQQTETTRQPVDPASRLSQPVLRALLNLLFDLRFEVLSPSAVCPEGYRASMSNFRGFVTITLDIRKRQTLTSVAVEHAGFVGDSN